MVAWLAIILKSHRYTCCNDKIKRRLRLIYTFDCYVLVNNLRRIFRVLYFAWYAVSWKDPHFFQREGNSIIIRMCLSCWAKGWRKHTVISFEMMLTFPKTVGLDKPRCQAYLRRRFVVFERCTQLLLHPDATFCWEERVCSQVIDNNGTADGR